MPYTTPALVRAAYPAIADTTVYLDATLLSLIDEFEQIAEEYRGISYLVRSVTETVTVPPGLIWTEMILDHAPVVAVTVFTFNGTAITRYSLDKRFGIISNVYNLTGSITQSADVVCTYTHGLVAPPTPVLRACMIYTRNGAKLDVAGTSRDVLSQAVDGATTRYSTPDWGAGRPTGYLEVDRLLNSVTDFRVPAIA
jgi:hypothetical protein